MERFIPLFSIVGWFGSVFAASFFINYLLARSVIYRYYRYFVGPGVIVHELSHALGCVVTGAHIVDIQVFKPEGGHVVHHQPQLQFFGEPIIALAPIWGTFLTLGLITWLLVPDLFSLVSGTDVQTVLGSIHWFSWRIWLYLYLVTSLAATIAPSKTDMRYALESLVLLFVVLLAASFIPGVPNLLLQFELQMVPFVYITLGPLSLALLISFLLALPYRNKHFVARAQIE